jgi:hypothetical protein
MRALAIMGLLILASPVAFLAACGGTDGEPPPAGAQDSSPAAPPALTARKDALAPIESADILVRESSPPQYALRIVSGLPSGCAQFSRIEVKRQDTAVDVTVWNTEPADSNVACTMIYGTAENTATLGSDFKSGQTYDVRVNGEQKTRFTAQ